EVRAVGQQTGVILPPTATNPRLESLQEDGTSPAIVVLCVIRRLALFWVEVLASRASVHASKPPARAAISGIVTAVPGPLLQRQPISATKSAQPLLDLHRPRRDRSSNRVHHYLGNVSAAASCQLRLDRHSNCGALLGRRCSLLF